MSEESKTQRMPRGIPYIVGNEVAERYSFYGMRSILVIFMTQHLCNATGELAVMDEAEAKGHYHFFLSAVYFFPLLGAILADAFLGKYRTILFLSIVYCFGHLALALDDTRLGLSVGLGLIALGSGGIKPCVSANVGDQFTAENQSLLGKAFGWFYFSVNFGSFLSTLLTPLILSRSGPHWAFGIPGILMLIATIVFWLGRKSYVHVPPNRTKFWNELRSEGGLRALGKLVGLYVFVAVFFSIYDQTASAWVLQAESLDRRVFGFEVLSAQMQVLNPVFVLLFIPLFSYVLYPRVNRYVAVTPLRKIGSGFLLTVPCVLLVAWLESRIQAGETPTIAWQVLAYVILTAAEVMIYQTGLELSYTQAPRSMKSFIMSFYMLAIALGNFFTSQLNFFIRNDDGSTKLGPVEYHLFFAGLMAAAWVVFLFVSRFFEERTYLQEKQS